MIDFSVNGNDYRIVEKNHYFYLLKVNYDLLSNKYFVPCKQAEIEQVLLEMTSNRYFDTRYYNTWISLRTQTAYGGYIIVPANEYTHTYAIERYSDKIKVAQKRINDGLYVPSLFEASWEQITDAFASIIMTKAIIYILEAHKKNENTQS